MSDASEIWTEFVGHCEAIEADADGRLLRAESEKEKQFCRGQAWAAKSIRRAVVHPKYRPESPASQTAKYKKALEDIISVRVGYHAAAQMESIARAALSSDLVGGRQP